MIKNIVFDLNGTMIFDGKYHEIAWEIYVNNLTGRSLTKKEFQEHILGHTNRDILEYFLGVGTISDEEILRLTEEKEAMYREMYVKDKENFKLVDGLPEYFDYLKSTGININIATGSNLTNLDFYFDKFDLGRWFDKSLVAYDDGTLRAKPAPDMYIKAMRNMKADPSETLVYEDGPSGVRAAKAAHVAKIIGIYGDSSEKLLSDTGICDELIHDYIGHNGL